MSHTKKPLFTKKIAGCVIGCVAAILLAVVLLAVVVSQFVVGFWSQTNIILDGPFEMPRHVEGRGDIRKTIDPDIQEEITQWLASRRLWWIDFNSYVPFNTIRTDNFSIRTTGCGTLIVLNFKQKSNGWWMQHVSFNDAKMRNILETMRSRLLEYLESLDDADSNDKLDDQLNEM